MALLIAPAAWAGITAWRGGEAGLPFAGPDVRTSGRRGVPGPTQLVDYLQANQRGEKYLVATLNANTAAPIIIETGEPVMALGGFSGGDRILTPVELAARVATQEVRYFYLPQSSDPGVAGRAAGQQGDLVRWIELNCRWVNLSFFQQSRWSRAPPAAGPAEGNRLFDCRR